MRLRSLAVLFFLTLLHASAGQAPDWLAGAIAAAPPGATLRVPAGVHFGPLVINQPLRLVGEAGAVIDGRSQGHVIEVRAPGVELIGLLVRGSGSNLSFDHAGVHVEAADVLIQDMTIVDTLHGIYLKKAPRARIVGTVIRGRASEETIDDPLTRGLRLASDELCSVELQQDQRGNGIHIWNCSDHLIERNDIRGTRDGIYFQFCDNTRIRDNVIAEVRYGLHYMYSDNNVFERNVFTRSAAGAAIMYSNGITLSDNQFAANRSHRAYGLLLHTVENTRIEHNRIEGNTVGVFLENSMANLVLSNRVTGNYIGLRLSDSSDDNQVGSNLLRGNVHPVETGGFNQSNRFTHQGRGNDWDGALKLDLTGDGIADTAHHETDLFGRWRRSFPEIGLLSGSPGERALRFVHARVAVPGIPAVKDERPLVHARLP